MCVRFTGISWEETHEVLEQLRDGKSLRLEDGSTRRPELFPGSYAPVILVGDKAQLTRKELLWGYDLEGKSNAVFNTRLETAASVPFWAESFKTRRCVVPAIGFYEKHATEQGVSPETKKSIKQLYRFSDAQGFVVLMAGIWDRDNFSIMTTRPHPVVAPVHDRSPVLLNPINALHWLRFEKAEPQRIELISQPLYEPIEA